MTKLEQVARAITEAIALQRVDPFSAAKFSGVNPPIKWDRVARAAVEALREPNEAMIQRGWELIRGNLRPDEIFPHMIEVVLDERPE
jgi:hypothetical protein